MGKEPVMSKLHFKIILMLSVILMFLDGYSADEAQQLYGAQIPSKMQKPQLLNEVGVYPPDSICIAATYYFPSLQNTVYQFDTILGDRINLSFFTAVFKKEGGLHDVDKVLDLGTGYGAIGLMAMGYGANQVVAT